MHPILIAAISVLLFTFLSNFATCRRERRKKNRKWHQENELINSIINNPAFIEEGQEN